MICELRLGHVVPCMLKFLTFLYILYAANMPLTKNLRVAIIDSTPALKSRNYLTKSSIPDSRVSTVTPATISFFKGMILDQICALFCLLSAVSHPVTIFVLKSPSFPCVSRWHFI